MCSHRTRGDGNMNTSKIYIHSLSHEVARPHNPDNKKKKKLCGVIELKAESEWIYKNI